MARVRAASLASVDMAAGNGDVAAAQTGNRIGFTIILEVRGGGP